MAKLDKRSINKLRAFRQLEQEMPEPNQGLTERILKCLLDLAVLGVCHAKLNKSAYKIAAAIEFFGEVQAIPEGERSKLSDITINPDIEHAAHMEPQRKITKLASELLELLPEGGQHYENVYNLYREAALVEGAQDRMHERFRVAGAKTNGDPKASRYRLYAEIMGGWWVCKQTAEDIPPRTMDSLRNPNGEYFLYLTAIFAASHHTQAVSPDEAHKTMLQMQKNEIETEIMTPQVMPPVPPVGRKPL